MANKQDKMMKNILGKLEGVDSTKIAMKDGRKGKKISASKSNKFTKSSEKVVIEDNGLKLTGEKNASVIDFSDIPIGRRYKKREALNEWITVDFVLLARDLHQQIFKRDWNLQIPAACRELKAIKDALYDVTDNNTNRILRDYVVFFFENYVREFVKEQKKFYFNQMRREDVLESFHNAWTYQGSIAKEKCIDKQEDILSLDKIGKAYSFGMDNLLYRYGIVIAINWLIVHKKKANREAAKEVMNRCKYIYEEGLFRYVKEATVKHAPYPNCLIFTKLNLFLEKIDTSLLFDVDFNDNKKINKKFSFFRKY